MVSTVRKVLQSVPFSGSIGEETCIVRKQRALLRIVFVCMGYGRCRYTIVCIYKVVVYVSLTIFDPTIIPADRFPNIDNCSIIFFFCLFAQHSATSQLISILILRVATHVSTHILSADQICSQ